MLEGFSEPYLPLSAPYIFLLVRRNAQFSSRPSSVTAIHTPAEQSKPRLYLLLQTRWPPQNNGAVLKLSCFPALPFPEGMVSIWPAGQLVG